MTSPKLQRGHEKPHHDVPPRLLMFNLVTNEDDPVLGFGVGWIRALARHCSAIDVLTMSAGPADLPANVRVFSVGKERGWSEPRRAVVFYRVLFSLLRRQDYDGCFAHMMPLFALLGAPLLKARRVPVTLWFTHISATRRLRFAVRAVDRVITADRASFSLQSNKLLVTGHGIDTGFFVPTESRHEGGPVRLLCVGRIDPIKQLDVLIDAIAHLKRDVRSPDIAVRILGHTFPGSQKYAAGLRSQVEHAQLSDVIHFEGPRAPRQVLEAYQGADIVISLTRSGFDKVALEAMSCGLPVVTTNPAFAALLHSAGAPEPAAPDAAAVAATLRSVLAMGVDHRAQIGAALRGGVVAKHSLDNLAEQLAREILFPARVA